MFDDGIFFEMQILHIAEAEAWSARTDFYVTADLETEGFIHCSTGEQLQAVAEAFYARRTGLVLLAIDTSAVDGLVVFEDLYDAGEEFPHVYGPIPVAAIVEARSFSVS